MKATITIIFALAICTVLQGQTDTIPNNDDSTISIKTGSEGIKVEVQTIDTVTGQVKDTTKLQMGTSTILIINDDAEKEEPTEDDLDWDKRHEFTSWNGIDIGLNGFLDANGNYELGEDLDFFELEQLRSRTISLNFAETKLRLIKDYVGLTTGLGIQYNNYKFKNDYTLYHNADTLAAFADSTISLKKNKLRNGWINIPLLLEFNTSNSVSNNVHLSIGAVGGWNFSTLYKQKYKRDGEREKLKHRGDWHVNPFKLDAMVRAGYRRFTLFATYRVNELFDTEAAPAIHPISLGLSISFD